MNKLYGCILALCVFLSGCAKPEPLKVLLIAGGCCHEYPEQMALLKAGFDKNMNCSVDTFVDGSDRTDMHSKLQEENWSSGYDVVLLSICFGHVEDDDYILSIVEEASRNNKGIVFIHCSLHNFRATEIGTNAWRDLMGLTSIGHEAGGTVVYETTKPEHPIMKGFPEVVEFADEEVYKIVKVGENVTELAHAFGTETQKYHPTMWTSEYNGCKIFGTSLGHSTSSYKRSEFVDLVARGVLWTAGKLSNDGTPETGYSSE